MTFKLFAIWVFVLIGRPQDLITFIQPARPALVMAAITLVPVFFKISLKGLSSVFNSNNTRKYIAFYLVMIAGIPFAYHRRMAFNYIFSVYLVNMLFFMVFLFLVDSFEKLKTILMIISISTFFYSVFGLLMGSFSDGRYVIYGNMFDPNDIAYVLISMFPLSFFFLLNREGILKKILAVVTIGASIILILLSGSRAGIVALGVVSALILFTKVGSFKRSYKVVFILGLILITSFYYKKINVERYLTLTDIGRDYNVKDESGRLHIWQRAFELLGAHPLTGVGVNCFPTAIGYYRESMDIIPQWQAVHNSYLQVVTETGLIGGSLFVIIVVGCLRNFSYCGNVRIKSAGINEFKNLAGLLQVAFIGHLITAFFLTQGYSIFFTLYFALSGVSLRLLSEFKAREPYETKAA